MVYWQFYSARLCHCTANWWKLSCIYCNSLVATLFFLKLLFYSAIFVLSLWMSIKTANDSLRFQSPFTQRSDFHLKHSSHQDFVDNIMLFLRPSLCLLWGTLSLVGIPIHFKQISCNWHAMDLLSDTKNYGMRMRRECRERFPRHRFQRKPPVSDPGMHHGTCVAHVPWCMSSLTRGAGENVPGIPGACATCNFTYLARDP